MSSDKKAWELRNFINEKERFSSFINLYNNVQRTMGEIYQITDLSFSDKKCILLEFEQHLDLLQHDIKLTLKYLEKNKEMNDEKLEKMKDHIQKWVMYFTEENGRKSGGITGDYNKLPDLIRMALEENGSDIIIKDESYYYNEKYDTWRNKL